MPEPVRVFVSHSHQDNAFGVRLVQDLRAALGGDESAVWYDVSGGLHGGDEWWRKIVAEITARPAFLLILSPDAMASGYVQTEFDLAFKQKHSPAGKKIIPILYKSCQPREDMTLLQMVSFLEPKPYEQAFGELLRALNLSGAPVQQQPLPATPPAYVAPPDRFPPRLAELGYRVAFLNGAEVILPPLCDMPAGPFLMGSDPNKDKDATDRELPQYWVTLAAYQIAKYPVTVAEYASFVRATGRAAPSGEDEQPFQVSWQTQLRQRLDHPVIMVDWRDATTYAKWLAKRTGQPWRLPSEAEWEKAARWDAATGSARLYPWGDTFDASRCNIDEGKKEMTTPVGSYPGGVSPCGALDMAGNVCEWTSSVYKAYPYTASGSRERAEPAEDRVLRGGSWVSSARYSRAAYRINLPPDDVYDSHGFRLVLAVSNPLTLSPTDSLFSL